MTEEEKAKQRIAKIAKSQELLAKAVNNLDRLFYEALLANIDKIAEDATELERIFNQFNRSQHSKVILQFARGVVEVGQLNADYFKDVAENLDSKDYETIKRQANGTLLKRFGLKPDGSIEPGMYLDSFINDKSIARTVREQAYKWQASGMGLDEFKRNLKLTVLGQPGASGIYSKYYNTYAYDTYQQADAQIQKHYADKLGLKAFLYLGGKMTTSREFCTARDGKVFIDTEIADWLTISFQGKPKTGYNPFTDRGGYNCRHHLNAITNAMAVARRSDLEIDEAGNLVIKSGDSKAKEVPAAKEFTPAKSIEDAEKWAKQNGLAKKVEWGEKTNKFNQLEQINIIQEQLFNLKNKYGFAELDELGVKNMGGSFTGVKMEANARLFNIDPSTLLAKNLQKSPYRGQALGYTYGGMVDGAEQLKRLVTHEVGHIVADQRTNVVLGENIIEELGKGNKFTRISKKDIKALYDAKELNVIERNLKQIGAEVEDLELYFKHEKAIEAARKNYAKARRSYDKDFTDYGYTSLNEAIAEAFVAREHGLKISETLLKVLDGIINAK